MNSLNIDISRLIRIFAESGVECKNLPSAIYDENHVLIKAVDISIYRIPEPDNPLLEISRLQVFSAQNCKRILAYNMDDNHIIAQFQTRKYAAKNQALKEIASQTKQKMMQYIDDLGF